MQARVWGEAVVPLHRGVYAVGHRALTPKSRYIAAVYACGRGALRVTAPPGTWTGLLRSAPHRGTGAARVQAQAGHRRPPHPRNRRPTSVRSSTAIPTTSVARTLVDLADVLSEERLLRAVDQAESCACST